MKTVTAAHAPEAWRLLRTYRTNYTSAVRRLQFIEDDPELTSREKQVRGLPIRDELTSLRENYTKAAAALVTSAVKQYKELLPRKQRIRGAGTFPDRATRLHELAKLMPVRDLTELVQSVGEDDAALYGIERAIADREDLDNDTRASIVAALDAPYMPTYTHALANLLVCQNEFARIQTEGMFADPVRVLNWAREAYVVPKEDDDGTFIVQEEAMVAAYQKLDLPRAAEALPGGGTAPVPQVPEWMSKYMTFDSHLKAAT